MLGFGSTFSESVMCPVAMKMSARNLPYVHRLHLVLNQFFALPAVVVIAATSIYQMEKGHWDFGHLWVSATIAILAVILLIAAIFFMTTKPGLG